MIKCLETFTIDGLLVRDSIRTPLTEIEKIGTSTEVSCGISHQHINIEAVKIKAQHFPSWL